MVKQLGRNNKSKSGIIINDISDHKMIFTYIENTTYTEKIDKFIKDERKCQTTMVNFVEELRSMRICEHFNQNVNENHEDYCCRFARLVNSAKEKHLQPKIVKYNKTRHKKYC